MTRTETSALFDRYLCIVNRSIDANKERFPHPVALGEDLADERVGVAIHESVDEPPRDLFTSGWDDDSGFEVLADGEPPPDITWRIPHQQIRRMVEDPASFVDSPKRLGLDWIKTRFAPDAVARGLPC